MWVTATKESVSEWGRWQRRMVPALKSPGSYVPGLECSRCGYSAAEGDLPFGHECVRGVEPASSRAERAHACDMERMRYQVGVKNA